MTGPTLAMIGSLPSGSRSDRSWATARASSGVVLCTTASSSIGEKPLAISCNLDIPLRRDLSLPSSWTSPSIRNIGLILRSEPSNALAFPMRPPFSRYSSVSTMKMHSLRLSASRAMLATSSTPAPSLAARAAIMAVMPTLMEARRVSTTSTGQVTLASRVAWIAEL